MKEAFTIYVEDDEELVELKGRFTVKHKNKNRISPIDTEVHLKQKDIKKYDGVYVSSDRYTPLLVKDGEC